MKKYIFGQKKLLKMLQYKNFTFLIFKQTALFLQDFKHIH